MKKGTTNPNKKKLIIDLEKSKAKSWKTVAQKLKKSIRTTPTVSLWKIEKHAMEGRIIVIPGKVVYDDTKLTKKNKVAALGFSENAKKVLGTSAITIKDALNADKTGKTVQVLV